MDDNERALFAVLDAEADQEVPEAARRTAERDLAAIREGMGLLGAEATSISRPRQWLSSRWLAVAAGIVALVAALAIVPGLVRDERAGPSIGMPGPQLSLSERVREADRIVVGTVTKVDHGRLDSQIPDETGDAYVLATVRVEEAIKGPGGEVVAFSYDFGGAVVTSEGSTRPWTEGDRVLLFLAADAGTVSAGLSPAHLQVAEGEAGRYFVDGDRLIDATFTLEDVRRAAGE